MTNLSIQFTQNYATVRLSHIGFQAIINVPADFGNRPAMPGHIGDGQTRDDVAFADAEKIYISAPSPAAGF